MERLETRELAYFIAVAEELHFGRAAARLGIAQPPLSRAIKQLEHRLGVTLLDRDSRRVLLTEAGEVFLHEGRKAMDAVAASARRAQRAGQPVRRLVLVMKPISDGGLLGDILSRYEQEAEAIPVEVLLCGVAEQAVWLREGRADVGLLHAPHDDFSGFDVEELFVEGQVVVLPRTHRLADRETLRLADLEGETLPRLRGQDDTTATGPVVQDSTQLLQMIALERTIAVLPASASHYLRRELVCVPLVDAAPITAALAWPERSTSRALAAFVRVAAEIAEKHRHGTSMDTPVRSARATPQS
jgi:DNA-binding transcriptional LysR family regulator